MAVTGSWRRRGAVVALTLGLGVPPATGVAESGDRILLFGNQDNVLHVYDVTGEVVAAQTEVDSQVEGDPDGRHRDTNGQLCFFEQDGEVFFVAGEDTDQGEATPFFDFIGLTDPGGEPNGWGIFRLDGDRLGEFRIRQTAKLVPTYQDHVVSQFEHYGCGFLSDGRLLLADIGDQFPGFPANGQLHIWFPPLDYFSPDEARYCKIAVDVPTAGGIHVDGQDRVYLTAQRDDVNPAGKRAGVYRFSGEWPTGPDADGGCGRTDGTGAPLVDEGRLTVEQFIPGGPQFLSPSAVVPAPAGGFYVSSVFDGRINEYDADGAFVREILAPPPQEQLTGPPYSTGTPLGLAIDSRGVVYYADLGVGLGPPPGPADGEGSIRRIRFDAQGDPMEPEVLDEDLDFPDGLGVLETQAETAVSVSGHAHTSVPNGTIHVDLDVTGALGDGAPPVGFVRYDELRPQAFRCAGTPTSLTRVAPRTVVVEGMVSCTRHRTAERFSLIIVDNGLNPPNQDAYDLTLFDAGDRAVYRFAGQTTVGLGDLTITEA